MSINRISACYSKPVVFKGSNDNFTTIDHLKKKSVIRSLSPGEEITIQNQEVLNKKLDDLKEQNNTLYDYLSELEQNIQLLLMRY